MRQKFEILHGETDMEFQNNNEDDDSQSDSDLRPLADASALTPAPGRQKKKRASKRKSKAGKRGTIAEAGSTKREGEGTLAEQLNEADSTSRSLARQAEVLSQTVQARDRTIQERERRVGQLESELEDANETRMALTKSNAARLLQIDRLEKELHSQRLRQKQTEDELALATRMMDIMLSFRDKQLTKDMSELVNDNMDLVDKAEKWKGRARRLEAERSSFVQRWRSEHLKASQAAREADGDADEAESEEEGGDNEEDEEGETGRVDEGGSTGNGDGDQILPRGGGRARDKQRFSSVETS